MKTCCRAAAFLLLLAPVVLAQEHYTEGPLWRVELIRVKPNQMDAYLTSLRESTKPLIEEEKREGLILDYKVFFKETKHDPEDWDICVAIQYKKHAALDGLGAKGETVRDKIMEGKQAAHQIGEKRARVAAGDLSQVAADSYFRAATPHWACGSMEPDPIGRANHQARSHAAQERAVTSRIIRANKT